MECKECRLYQGAQNPCIGGNGPSPCDILIVGEAPGYYEDQGGKPFQGRAGTMLTELLQAANLSRDQVRITNAVRCRPSDNRTPTMSEIAACRPHLEEEIAQVRPRFILLLGSTAFKSALNRSGVTKHRGAIFQKGGISYLVTLHPAALFRQPQQIPWVRADFERFGLLVRGQLEQELNWSLVNSPSALRACLTELSNSPFITFDFETNSLNPCAPDSVIRCLGLATEGHEWVIPLEYPGSFLEGRVQDQEKVLEWVYQVMRGKKIIGHNGKFDCKWFTTRIHSTPQLTFDTMLASHLLDENSPHGLKPLSRMHFRAPEYDIPQPVNPEEVPLVKLAKYCAYDVHYTTRLYLKQRKDLEAEPHLRRIFTKLVMPLSRMLTQSELWGVYVDPERFPEALQASNLKVGSCLEELNALAPYPVNWNSSQQVARLLYSPRPDGLGLDIIETTAKGAPSTAEGVLTRLHHPVVDKLLEYRGLIKLNQFLHGWKDNLGGDHHLRPTFKIHGTVTGRLSCADPNLQQVPRDPFVRSLITAPPGWVFVEADYSQVELRVAAMVANESTLIQLFQTGQDPHRRTAATIMGVPEEEVNKAQRKAAKAVNFGFLYGMGAAKFRDYAREKYQVELTENEAREYRQRFFDLYSGLPSWHERQRRLARKYKYVRTLLGRKRRLPDIDSMDSFLRAEAERQAINSPVQGTATDFNAFSAIRIHKELPQDAVRVLGLVHDAILMVVREDRQEEMLPLIHEIMVDRKTIERVFRTKIPVPLEVEVSVGPWGAGKVVTF